MKEKIYEASKGFSTDFEVSADFSKKYVPLPTGGYIFEMTKAYIDPTNAVCKITFETLEGVKHVEKYGLINEEGEIVQGAVNAVARIIAGALQIDVPMVNNKNLKKCIGRYIFGEIIHQKYNGRIYDHIDTFSIEAANGFNDADYVMKDPDEDSEDVEVEDAE